MTFKTLLINHNDDGTYTVTVDGKPFVFSNTIDLAHFLEDIGA